MGENYLIFLPRDVHLYTGTIHFDMSRILPLSGQAPGFAALIHSASQNISDYRQIQ